MGTARRGSRTRVVEVGLVRHTLVGRLVGRGAEAARWFTEADGLSLVVAGAGPRVVRQWPVEGTWAPARSTVYVWLGGGNHPAS